ncbi:MAG: hypothetical protein HUK06_05665 [Bacteroidaceae bacterium]|nr:hypothetical protein [Bacteroidaceae bacterium]
MRNLILLTITLLCLSVQQTFAAEKDEVLVTNLYAFGYGGSLNDTVSYVTEIVKMPVVKMEKKTGFLVKRSEYTQQFKKYLAGIGVSYPTCAIIFDMNKGKLYKKFLKLLKKAKKANLFVKTVSVSEFSFSEIVEEE